MEVRKEETGEVIKRLYLNGSMNMEGEIKNTLNCAILTLGVLQGMLDQFEEAGA